MGRVERHTTANREIAYYLLEQGFTEVLPPKAVYGSRGLVSFEGILKGTSQSFRIRIDIPDWDFADYPRIYLLNEPDGFRPHVDQYGGICYLASDSIIFDRHRPVDNLQRCLSLATEELGRQSVPGYIQNESRYEFIRYWSDDWSYLLGTVHPNQGIHPTKITHINGTRKLISDSTEETKKIAGAVKRELPLTDIQDESFPAWVLTLEKDPWLDRCGTPKTWRDLWAWIQMVDERAYQRLISLVNSKGFAEAQFCTIVFRHGDKWFGVQSAIPKEVCEQRALRRFQRGANSWLANYLRNGRGSDIMVYPFTTVDVTEHFVHGRNLPKQNSLGCLRIHLVGAGAIGSFLAQQLSRLGAGTEEGEFRIIDPQLLSSENLGRHVLGIDFLLHSKATAMATFLLRQFPMANIHGIADDARQVPSLFDCDLLIDATGEEALSLVLNEMHQEYIKTHEKHPAMLFAWVLANGEVVQALLSDGGDHACYDCLNLSEGNELERQRFPVIKKAPNTRFIGCHTMRPYATTAPAVAAALAAQMAIDWKTGVPSSRLRTLYLDSGSHLYHHIPDLDPGRLPECGTCSMI